MASCLVPQASASLQNKLINQVDKLKEEVKSKDRKLAMKEKSLELGSQEAEGCRETEAGANQTDH